MQNLFKVEVDKILQDRKEAAAINRMQQQAAIEQQLQESMFQMRQQASQEATKNQRAYNEKVLNEQRAFDADEKRADQTAEFNNIFGQLKPEQKEEVIKLGKLDPNTGQVPLEVMMGLAERFTNQNARANRQTEAQANAKFVNNLQQLTTYKNEIFKNLQSIRLKDLPADSLQILNDESVNPEDLAILNNNIADIAMRDSLDLQQKQGIARGQIYFHTLREIDKQLKEVNARINNASKEDIPMVNAEDSKLKTQLIEQKADLRSQMIKDKNSLNLFKGEQREGLVQRLVDLEGLYNAISAAVRSGEDNSPENISLLESTGKEWDAAYSNYLRAGFEDPRAAKRDIKKDAKVDVEEVPQTEIQKETSARKAAIKAEDAELVSLQKEREALVAQAASFGAEQRGLDEREQNVFQRAGSASAEALGDVFDFLPTVSEAGRFAAEGIDRENLPAIGVKDALGVVGAVSRGAGDTTLNLDFFRSEGGAVQRRILEAKKDIELLKRALGVTN